MRTWMVVAALSLAACSDSDPDFTNARARWAEAAGSRPSYHFEWRESCFAGCLSRGAIVFVTSDQISSASYAGTGAPLSTDDRARVKTIDGLFDWIAETRGDVDQLTVTYDDALGYPTSVVEDPKQNRTDDELGIQIRDLVLGVP